MFAGVGGLWALLWLLGCSGWYIGCCYVVAGVFWVVYRVMQCVCWGGWFVGRNYVVAGVFWVVCRVLLFGCWDVLGGFYSMVSIDRHLKTVIFCHQIGYAHKKRHHCLQTPNWSMGHYCVVSGCSVWLLECSGFF